MDHRLKYCLRKRKTLPPEIAIKKAFYKAKNKGLGAISKISADTFSSASTDAEFLKKIWGSMYQFNNSEKTAKLFPRRKKPNLLIDSLEKKILFPQFMSISLMFKEVHR